MKLKSRERLFCMGFIAYMTTLVCMMYLVSQTSISHPVYKSTSSSSESSITRVQHNIKEELDNISLDKKAIVMQIKRQLQSETGIKDSVEQYQHILRLLKENKPISNTTKKHEKSEIHIENKHLPTKNKDDVIDIHVKDIQLLHFRVSVPFSLKESNRDQEIKRLGKIVHVLYKKRKIWKKEKRTPVNVYERVSTNWERFHNDISQYDLYPPDSRIVKNLLHDLAHMNITYSELKSGGTQIKLLMTMKDDGEALFKPMRFSRVQETLPDHFYFSDYERHNAEIAAFHLDRLLGFRRSPPVAGRYINITRDVLQHAANYLLKTFFISPAGNMCFYGKCDYYCDSGHAICGRPIMLEGSMCVMLPSSKVIIRKSIQHPWRRSYHKRKRAVWEEDNDYCNIVKETPPYDKGRRLLDLMDLAVYDFLMGNQDRHHYGVMEHFGNDSYLVHIDHGRAFGKPHFDDMSALAPLYQCCLIRLSTLQTLLSFIQGPVGLGEALKNSLKSDVLYPMLTETHYTALDRRLKIILQLIYECLPRKASYQTVIKDDGY